MADCSTSVTQEWVYENDGLLRSAAAVDLCLNSHALDGVTVLGPCTDSSAVNASDVRYDLTIQGDVIPRWNDDLAVVPASAEIGSRVVVKVRDGSMAQRWATDNVASVFPKIRPSADTGRPATKEVNIMPTSAVSSRPPEESGGTPEPRDDGPYGQDPYGDDRNGQDRRPDTRRVGDDRSGADEGSDGSDGPPEEPALRLRPADAVDRLPAGRDLPSPAMLRRAGETDRAEG